MAAVRLASVVCLAEVAVLTLLSDELEGLAGWASRLEAPLGLRAFCGVVVVAPLLLLLTGWTLLLLSTARVLLEAVSKGTSVGPLAAREELLLATAPELADLLPPSLRPLDAWPDAAGLVLVVDSLLLLAAVVELASLLPPAAAGALDCLAAASAFFHAANSFLVKDGSSPISSFFLPTRTSARLFMMRLTVGLTHLTSFSLCGSQYRSSGGFTVASMRNVVLLPTLMVSTSFLV